MAPDILTALGILPLANWVVVGFAPHWLVWTHRKPQFILTPGTGEERAETSRFILVLLLISYGIVLGSVLWWMRLHSITLEQVGLRTDRWVSALLRGGYLGIAWAGLLPYFLRLYPETKRSPIVIPGLGGPYSYRIGTLLAGSIVEELWRAFCVSSLVVAGYSSWFAIAISSLAFALAFLLWGTKTSMVAAVGGGLFASLFLWQQSFAAPLSAHLAFQGYASWEGMLQASTYPRRKGALSVLP